MRAHLWMAPSWAARDSAGPTGARRPALWTADDPVPATS
jgi:hypothetical protein